MDESELIEQLADKEHASWARWMLYLFSKCEYSDRITIPPELAGRWDRQARTDYKDLTEKEKQSDRQEVAHILPIIANYVRKEHTMDTGGE